MIASASARDAGGERSRTLAALLAAGDYQVYAYSYPHKTAYRPFHPSVPLRALWAEERRAALFLYLHVPFCEQRCGFCNLFAQAQPRDDLPERYVAALERQAEVMAGVLGEARFAELAVGGGTPSFLPAPLLDRLLGVAARLGARGVPTSVEISPATFDAEKLAVLVARGTTRVSVGVQSFVAEETRAVQRHQDARDVERALAALRDAIPERNVDLIYGLPGQTRASFLGSIDRALELGATELYLYPLYVRPRTALYRTPAWQDQRLALYRAGREHLLGLGFRQLSMRLFRAPRAEARAARPSSAYRCQEDGMLGLGAGARSYTRTVHYSTPYAVSTSGVRDGIQRFIQRSDADHALARHGFVLNEEEQRRRFVLLTLLEAGLDRAAYHARFGADVLADLPELEQALTLGLVRADAASLTLTERGLEESDVIGHWLESEGVRRARAEWTPE